MSRIAIVLDSASDITPEAAAVHGIRVVPLLVSFGDREFRAGVDLSTADFWARMLAPDAPFPTTAAAPPGAFVEAFGAAFAEGADAIVCVTVGSKLSGTYKSALIGAQQHPGKEIHVIDSNSASWGISHLAVVGREMADAGAPAGEIAETLTRRIGDIDLYVALDTLEYLRKGGRLSAARAAIGTVLSVKPIITVIDGLVETKDRVRTRAKARERVIELLTSRPVERLAILQTVTGDIESFRDEVVARLPGGIDPTRVTIETVGPSVGPHLGPGCVGGVVLLKR